MMTLPVTKIIRHITMPYLVLPAPDHRGDLVGPRRSNQKAGLMKDRVDRLAQGTKSQTRPARLGRRRCDSDVSAAPAQARSEAAKGHFNLVATVLGRAC